MQIEDFITRWKQSGGSERANFQTFANELCDVLGVSRPAPASETASANAYHFEHPVTFIHTGSKSRGFVDLYRVGHFVMEAKQGVTGTPLEDDAQPALLADLPKATRKGHGTRGTRGWDDTMMRARNQADGYARAVSRMDGWPPFLLVVDVGHVIEVYADFSGQGQGYTQYPDGNRYRITMDDLRQPETLNRERAAEEARGLVRYLRPDYQNPAGRAAQTKGQQGAMDLGPTVSTTKTPWPKSLPDQIAAVQAALMDMGEATPEQIARQFQRGRAGTVQPLLESLSALGQARVTDGGRFAV